MKGYYSHLLNVCSTLVVVSLPCVGDVKCGAKELHKLFLIVFKVSLHDVHARSKQTLKGTNLQDYGAKHRGERSSPSCEHLPFHYTLRRTNNSPAHVTSSVANTDAALGLLVIRANSEGQQAENTDNTRVDLLVVY